MVIYYRGQSKESAEFPHPYIGPVQDTRRGHLARVAIGCKERSMRPLEKVIDVEEIIFKIVDGAKVDGVGRSAPETDEEAYRINESQNDTNDDDDPDFHVFIFEYTGNRSFFWSMFTFLSGKYMIALIQIYFCPRR